LVVLVSVIIELLTPFAVDISTAYDPTEEGSEDRVLSNFLSLIEKTKDHPHLEMAHQSKE
jgi:hypothetical protein